MPFQIEGLDPADFAPLFTLSDSALQRMNARRVVVDAHPGTPCRISLTDAAIGETVLLINYEHQPAHTPFQSRHAIFVRAGIAQARPEVGTVPPSLLTRLISLRGFDVDDMMIAADVVPGHDLAAALAEVFENADVSYVHLHYAKQGCFAARARRA
ncbi:DUF1203 domain-containing protein [Ketogulonicigenium vulgare]|uniref:DUF1203 domain-containing protein n=1 Tax=Ketogulonicigenium vulgare (strain WSH-001) TaxID=759362 RepID=F9Y6Q4_KETVW|nr:DUF1203 domain-containing protein [Ketogulonicigenium vulgare]ADO43922.1 conserved hypothetical protein [Ketogulonicigenium vulgare Y25]AEM42174.1 protein of unknown function DUF1203 [Ketogulonicigenium vulgare WSH-001]ALJ79800.1 hypothetical protein KVH_00465 [Ketogulonicigenium vulgare]ANW32715.1 hypothetical protein KvSKV_00475 [Ketogulonicigenium vulgare]AOZ55954.1 hypothetical protein KVC_2952 [Ketogulonicigenium vulgare]